MTHSEFTELQDNLLKMKGRELADLLGVAESQVSAWRKGKRDVPDYIARALRRHAADSAGDLVLPFTVDDIIAISRAAVAAGRSTEDWILTQIKLAAAPAPAKILYMPGTEPDTIENRVAEDPPSE